MKCREASAKRNKPIRYENSITWRQLHAWASAAEATFDSVRDCFLFTGRDCFPSISTCWSHKRWDEIAHRFCQTAADRDRWVRGRSKFGSPCSNLWSFKKVLVTLLGLSGPPAAIPPMPLVTLPAAGPAFCIEVGGTQSVSGSCWKFVTFVVVVFVFSRSVFTGLFMHVNTTPPHFLWWPQRFEGFSRATSFGISYEITSLSLPQREVEA